MWQKNGWFGSHKQGNIHTHQQLDISFYVIIASPLPSKQFKVKNGDNDRELCKSGITLTEKSKSQKTQQN